MPNTFKALSVIMSFAVGLSVPDRALETTSMKENMAKYRAAVGKQAPEVPLPKTSAPVNPNHDPTPEYNG